MQSVSYTTGYIMNIPTWQKQKETQKPGKKVALMQLDCFKYPGCIIQN